MIFNNADSLNKNSYNYHTIKQLVKFCLVGCVGVLIQYSLFLLLYKVFSVYYVTSSVIGCFVGAMVIFHFNRRWTFSIQGGQVSKQFLKFIILMILSFIVNGVSIFLLTDVGHIKAEISQIITMGITASFNFTGSKFWVYR